jgi:hypothetical protein
LCSSLRRQRAKGETAPNKRSSKGYTHITGALEASPIVKQGEA